MVLLLSRQVHAIPSRATQPALADRCSVGVRTIEDYNEFTPKEWNGRLPPTRVRMKQVGKENREEGFSLPDGINCAKVEVLTQTT